MNFKDFTGKILSFPTVIIVSTAVIFLGFLIYILYPVLTNTVLIGCDLAPQYYLAEKMLEYVQDFHLSGYDANWFGGYPTFVFYNPLPYLTACFLHLISFKLVSLYFCLNLILFTLPFLFLIGIYYASQVFFNDKNISLWALFFGLVSLLTTSASTGVGLQAEFLVGLYANAFTWPILLFLLASIERMRQTGENKYLFLAIILFSALILSHIFVTIFALIVGLIYFFIYFKTLWKKLLIVFFSGLAITIFWWLPFILNIGYTSVEQASSPGNQLSALYPGGAIFGFLPIAFTFIGLFFLLKTKQKFFPIAFLVGLVFLSGNFLADITKLPLHFYRFTGGVMIFNIFISAVGLNYIFTTLLQKIKEKYSKIITALLVWFLIMYAGLSLDFFNTEYFYSELFVKNSPHYVETVQMIDYIKSNNTGRLVFDDVRAQLNLNGGRHYFDWALPLEGVPDLRGLLIESSLSEKYAYENWELFYYETFLQNLIGSNGDGNAFRLKTLNGNSVGNFDDKIAEKIKTDIKNLSFYGVKNILVFNNYPTPILDFANSNYNAGIINIKKIIGIYTLLEINQESMPMLSETDYRPFLFVEPKLFPSTEQTFKNFSLGWYINGYAADYPIIYSKKQIKNLSSEDLEHIQGYIISLKKPLDFIENYQFPPDKAINCPSQPSLAYWGSVNKPVIILNTRGNCLNGFSNIYFVAANNNKQEFLKNVLSVMQGIGSSSANFTKIEPQELTNERIKFDSNKGVFINYSYFPKWQSNDKNQTVFWATPSMMFVFGKGETELNYK